MIEQRVFRVRDCAIRVGKRWVALAQEGGIALERIGSRVRICTRKPAGKSYRFVLSDLCLGWIYYHRFRGRKYYGVCGVWVRRIFGRIPNDIYIKAVK